MDNDEIMRIASGMATLLGEIIYSVRRGTSLPVSVIEDCADIGGRLIALSKGASNAK
jgi:hypothetical protein